MRSSHIDRTVDSGPQARFAPPSVHHRPATARPARRTRARVGPLWSAMMTSRTEGQGPSTEAPDGNPRPHQLDLPFDPTSGRPGVPRDRELDTAGPNRRGPNELDAPVRAGSDAPEGPDDRDPSLDAGPCRGVGPGERDTIYVDRHITRLGVRVHGRTYSSPAVQAARMAGERRVRVAVDAADPRWIFALVRGAWHRVPCGDAPAGKAPLRGGPRAAARPDAANRALPSAGTTNVIDLEAARRKRSAASEPSPAGSR